MFFLNHKAWNISFSLMKCNSLLLNKTINRASCLSNISHWRTLRIRNASNDCAKRSLTAAANDTWQARFVWLQFIFHAFNGHTKRREPDTAQHWRSSVDYTAAAAASTATGCLCAGSKAGRSGGCFSYNNNILCSAVWLFMHLWRCLCEKLYSKPKSG